MSGYTIEFHTSDGRYRSEGFSAPDDFGAMLMALAIADKYKVRVFRLDRTGFGGVLLRNVAIVTDKVG